ncbi:class C sortase [Galactobacter valiniphilus]|uniref:class C sortase n=1 Tax=Galactobacter valiniphilus TaxID=2676122 RepID=UPI003735EA05
MSIIDAPREAPARRGTSTRGRRSGVSAWFTAGLLVVGALVMLYPSGASWFADVLQAKESGNYVSAVESLTPDSRSTALVEAEEYNASLASGERVVDPFASPDAKTVKTDDPYWSLLDPAKDGIMARIRIPSITVNLPIYHGTGVDVLRNGVGHLQGTALPVGGDGTHAVLTGHRGLPESTMFTDLDQLKAGDMIYVDVLGRTLAYRVTTNEVKLPTQTDSLRPVMGKDLLTLITCTPIGVNSHRILVTAERVTPTPPSANVVQTAVGFPWWAVILVAVLLAAGLYLIVAKRSERRKAAQEAEEVAQLAAARDLLHDDAASRTGLASPLASQATGAYPPIQAPPMHRERGGVATAPAQGTNAAPAEDARAEGTQLAPGAQPGQAPSAMADPAPRRSRRGAERRRREVEEIDFDDLFRANRQD